MLVKHEPPLPRRNIKRTERILTQSPTLEEILKDICDCFGQTVEDIKSKRQYDRYIIPRRIYCYVSHVLTNESCGDASAFINRDHTTYLDRIDQCIVWFEINEPSFIEDWNIYLSNSKVWKEYYLLKKQALIQGCSEYIEKLREEAKYWKRKIRQAKEQKRRWERQVEKATKNNNTEKLEVAKSNIEKYTNMLAHGTQSLSSINYNNYKFL